MRNLESMKDIPQTTSDQAASWFLRLQEETQVEAVFVDWQHWLTASSEHRLAYEKIEDVALRMRTAPASMLRLPSALEMLNDDYDGSQPIAEWKQGLAGSIRQRPATAHRLRYAAAAGLILTLGLGSWLGARHMNFPADSVAVYRAAAWQQQTIALPDGSRVTLDAGSILKTRLTSRQRLLQLDRGEAYFEVARDARPFSVSAGITQVTALGTAFNVKLNGERTIVAVIEGKVSVTATAPLAEAADDTGAGSSGSAAPNLIAGLKDTRRLSTQLSAGEAVSYGADSGFDAIPSEQASLATGWLSGRRQYRNEPLRNVLADVDRYTGRHTEITDSAAGELKFTGTLNLHNSAAWLQGLSVALPVRVTEDDTGTLIVEMAH